MAAAQFDTVRTIPIISLPILNDAPVAQLDRALVFGTKGWEFEPLRAHFYFPPFTNLAFLRSNRFVTELWPKVWAAATAGSMPSSV
jgi:hypothetical protein